MRRLVGWIGGALGGIAAYRLLRRRPQVATEAASAEPDSRVEELREKLAESRTGEPVVEEPPTEAGDPESPDERRQRVHEEGRAAIDEMKGE